MDRTKIWMVNKELIDEDMYITSRNADPVRCEKCSQFTTTHIRVPSLNDYFSWCENCKSIPLKSWEQSNYENLIQNFKTYSPSYVIKSIKSYVGKKLNSRQLDIFFSCLESGYSKKESYRQSLSESKKFCKEYLSNTKPSTFFINSPETPTETLISQIPEFPMYATFKTDTIIDLNKVMVSILPKLSDLERKALAILFEEHQIDELLNEDIREKLYTGINTKELDKYSKVKKSQFLGLSTRNQVQYKLNKIEFSAINKIKNVFNK